jgi:hypothetical protein
VVPHHGTNWAALRLTAQIGRDAVLSESYGRGYWYYLPQATCPPSRSPVGPSLPPATAARKVRPLIREPALKRRASKRKKEEESNQKVEQIFRTRA